MEDIPLALLVYCWYFPGDELAREIPYAHWVRAWVVAVAVAEAGLVDLGVGFRYAGAHASRIRRPGT